MAIMTNQDRYRKNCLKAVCDLNNKMWKPKMQSLNVPDEATVFLSKINPARG